MTSSGRITGLLIHIRHAISAEILKQFHFLADNIDIITTTEKMMVPSQEELARIQVILCDVRGLPC